MDADARPLPEGVPFGRYLIRRRLARGGMGEVFLADQLGPLGPVRPVALKRMLPKVARDKAAAEMFLGEMETAARLNHPNIATTYDFGEIDGIYFLAMEYVEGLTLRQILEVVGPLPLRAALEVTIAVAAALEHAHGRLDAEGTPAPVVHRDVSPHNVMLSTAGGVKLLDFGIARTEAATLGGRVEGKMAYAAPEQLSGAPADRRADLWALGVLLYEAVSGMRPFETNHPGQILERAAKGAWPRLGELRPEGALLDPIVSRALAFDPGKRWPSAESLRLACVSVLAKLGPEPGAPWPVVGGVNPPSGAPNAPRTATGMNPPPGANASLNAIRQLVHQAGGPKKPTKGVDATMMQGSEATSTGIVAPPSLDAATTLPIAPRPALKAPVPPKGLSSGRLLLIAAIGALSAGLLGTVLAWMLVGSTETVVPLPLPSAPSPSAEPLARSSTGSLPLARAQQPEPSEAAEPTATPSPSEAAPEPHRSPPRRTKRDRTVRAVEARPTAAPSPTPTAAGTLGVLAVRTTPWSRVSLDGKDLGASPIASVPVPGGPHVLELTAGEGGGSRKVEIHIRPGGLTKVFVDFGSGTVRVEPSP